MMVVDNNMYETSINEHQCNSVMYMIKVGQSVAYTKVQSMKLRPLLCHLLKGVTERGTVSIPKSHWAKNRCLVHKHIFNFA